MNRFYTIFEKWVVTKQLLLNKTIYMIHQQTIRPQKLFFASCMALLATAMTFAIRANLIEELGSSFKISAPHMGLVLGTAFWGFTLSMMFGGLLCDILGMKKLLIIAFVGHVLGIVLTIFASGFWSLFISTLFIGIANGMVEAACNPLVASLYPSAKTTKLNQLHVWFPGGIVIGGLLAFALQAIHIPWQFQVASI
jgi:MFS family permease